MTAFQQVEALAKKHGYGTYTDYLRSEHWRGLRQAMNLKFNPCCSCSGRSTIPHHMRYRDLIDVTVDDLAPMCMKCHDDFHLACRMKGVDYIGMTPLGIKILVAEFRMTPFYIKREEKLKRRRSGIKVVRTTNKQAKSHTSIFKGCLRRCRSEKYSIASLENLKKRVEDVIAEKTHSTALVQLS